ncbi:protein of unknown function [Poseidonocella pacifica]|uniref:YjiS-like domain-containing protein n=1 Tax=Poseidonocella pacifica TaxID=871651 RepID=A0A1I0YAB5_9RHOB|nr:DUF1127 domain-containing protein [Poseidonocella pacifica]SFB10279.1 protein of unknown function [Poseidonocella pacifica]
MFSKAISGFRQDGSVKRTNPRGLLELRRQRLALSHLTPRQLSDIGISPAEAGYKTAGSFWDAPANWRG